MIAPAFTPGPWEPLWGNATRICISAEEMDVAEVLYTSAQRGRHTANAYLIAAAPTLFTKVAIAATIFREYERLHMAKGTVDGDAKARRNAQYAEEMEAALAAAQGIEAPSGDETRSGSAEGESPVLEEDAPKTQAQGSNNAPE